mmetsp:Transcript_40201/g.90757  ORF Transcript_40201/g.90757 Transcript_40201/m.90757 type:complete len:303 (+) Transcript_40201:78-986(+)
MGAKCLRASEELDDQAGDTGDSKSSVHKPRGFASPVAPQWVVDAPEERKVPSIFDTGPKSPDLFKFPGEQVRRTSSELYSPAPPVRWSRSPQVPVPVILHVYNIGTASIGRAINKILKPLGTGIFHCGVEVYGCEWSYSDTTTGLGDGVFPSKPMCCDGHDYCESVPMGKTGTSEVEVARLISLLKKDWPVHEYDTLKRNCCHFSHELCQRLGVGGIPPWVMNLAGAGAAIAATGDITCCRQVAAQVGKSCCCGVVGATGDDAVEVVDVIDQQPVLPPLEEGASRRHRRMARASEHSDSDTG